MFKIAYLSVSFSALGSASAFIVTILAARFLGPDSYGQAIHLINISALVSIFISFGFQYHFSNAQNNNQLDDNELHKAVSLMFLGAIIVWVFLTLFSPGSLPNHIYVLIVLHSVFYLMVEKIFFFRIAKAEPISAAFFRSFLSKSIALIFFLFLYLFLEFDNILVLVIANILGFFIVLLFHHQLFKFKFVDFEHISNVKIYYLVQLVYYLPSFLLRVSFAYVAGYVALSFMMISIILGQSITLISTAMTNQFSPQLRTHFLANNMTAFKDVLTHSIIVPSGAIIGALVFVMFNAKFFPIFIGQEYNDQLFFLMLFIVLLGPASNVFTGMTGTALLMSGKQKIELVIGISKAISAFFIFSIFYFIDPQLCVPVAIMFSEVLANILKLLMVKKEFNIWVLDLSVVKHLAFQVFIYTLTLSLIEILMQDGLWQFYCSLLSTAALFLLTFLFNKRRLD